jgi:hypothetical protein
MKKLSLDFIKRAISQTDWDFGNQVLYDLCHNYFLHKKSDHALAKIWLIGRAYSASIERRRKNMVRKEDGSFYVDVAASKISKSQIDNWFSSLSKKQDRDSVVLTHFKLTELFAEISGLEKRSLASKYLHFHFPESVYIYDAFAQKALWDIVEKKSINRSDSADKFYTRFYDGCVALNNQISESIGRSLTPRELDKVLLAHHSKLKK